MNEQKWPRNCEQRDEWALLASGLTHDGWADEFPIQLDGWWTEGGSNS